jgi:hypothetical protein
MKSEEQVPGGGPKNDEHLLDQQSQVRLGGDFRNSIRAGAGPLEYRHGRSVITANDGAMDAQNETSAPFAKAFNSFGNFVGKLFKPTQEGVD